MAALKDTSGEGVPTPFRSPIEQAAYFTGLVHGHANALSLRLGSVVFRDSFLIADILAATESAPISRDGSPSDVILYRAVQAQMDARPFWKPSDRWGDDPFDGKTEVHSE
jgi:hypothetical protein